ncbi:hypothetical protein [Rufibacter tibetensis]|uniref:Uncharacterized protein n=1 Tax=Rufibacter tibetensis TaxID=512763 RepID=A0A0N7HX05_9BACT|nr:hypothetical protein [Rufibacter tibetensis]ALJ00705.1 hypothetical protein DC20_19130 [Rufibacter tibetensis]
MDKETIIQGRFALIDCYFFKASEVWHLVFEDNLRVQVECFWRLLENGRIKWTSKDHGQLYAHKTPINLETELRKSLLEEKLATIQRNVNTGDLYLGFENDFTVEILTDSSGYECWSIINGDECIYGLGRGEKV